LPYDELINKIEALWDEVESLGSKWVMDSLKTADPYAADLDGYIKPLITLAELLRLKKLPDVSRDIYERAMEIIDEHCRTQGIDLHRGAIYANYAIAQFVIGRYSQALPWLHAAANEDICHRTDITTIYESYAFSENGIFNQWLKMHVLPKLPAAVMAFVSTELGISISDSDVRALIRWLAGRGDLNLLTGIVEYASVGTMTDYHAEAVRLASVRDLATLFEVLLKMLGKAHNSPDVALAFATPPTLAGTICHMHFADKRRDRRRKPSLNLSSRPGLFRNSVAQWPGLLAAIDAGIDRSGDAAYTPDQVWQYLNTTTLCGTDSAADAVAKRILLAYRLRNETSHNINPTDPAMAPHYDDFRLWLLEAVLSVFFWVTKKTAAVRV